MDFWEDFTAYHDIQDILEQDLFEEEDMNYFEQKLKEKHMTQNELATRTGLTAQSIGYYKSGKYKLRQLDNIYNMAIALDIPLEEFVKGLLGR